MKQLRQRKRVISRGVEKHKIKCSAGDTHNQLSLIETTISARNLNRIHGLANFCWVYLVVVSSKLCLIPLKPGDTRHGNFEGSSVWGKLAHYSIVTAVLTLFAHKIIVTVDVMFSEDISMRTYMCLCYVLLLFLAATTCSGSTVKSHEMQGLLNSWDPILQQLEQMTGKRRNLFNITDLCLKIIAITCNLHLSALVVSLLSLAFDELPVCLYPTFKGSGIISGNNLPNMFWQIAIYPFELMTLLLPMVATAFIASVIVIALEVMRAYISEMR